MYSAVQKLPFKLGLHVCYPHNHNIINTTDKGTVIRHDVGRNETTSLGYKF